MIALNPIIDFRGENHLQDIYITGLLALIALALIVGFAYVVIARAPDGDSVFIGLFGALVVAAMWPFVATGGAVAALVLGLRGIVHYPAAKREAAEERRAAEKRELRAREDDLGLEHYPLG